MSRESDFDNVNNKRVRTEFEKWALEVGFPLEKENDGYFDDFTNCAWDAWRTAWDMAYSVGKTVSSILAPKKRKKNTFFWRKRR